jgi:hypothetical protein
MKFIRGHFAFKVLWFVMALHILNCSVDTPDPQPENVPEDLSYNDMESIVEIVLEQVLDIDNAIAEKDDPDTDGDNGLNQKKGLDFSYHPSFIKTLLCNSSIAVCKHALYKEKYSEQFHPELIPPPPKA